MEDAKYLCFTDLYRLHSLNLTEFERNKDDPPSFEVVFNFHEADLPVGMGLFTLDDNDSGSHPAVYAAGGEKRTRDIPETHDPREYRYRLNRMMFLDESYGDDGMSRKVFRLEPNNSRNNNNNNNNNNNKTTGKNAQKFVAVESSSIPHMITPKPNALTAKIDGKVYVMANQPFFYDGRSRFPMFEVYDPVANSWETLEQCPYNARCTIPSVWFVLNHWLVTYIAGVFWIYDVDAQVWFEEKQGIDLIRRHFSCFSSQADPVPPPYLFGTVATYEDLTIAYTGRFHGVMVYYPPYNVGPKHQRLDGLDCPFEIDDESLNNCDCSYDPDLSHQRFGHILHMGGGKMCFFCSVCDFDHFIVTIFQLKLERLGRHYCSASADVLCSHSYHLHELPQTGYSGFPRQVFIMGELSDIHNFQDDVRNAGSKRQLEPLLEVFDVDAISKKLETNPPTSPQMTDSGVDDKLGTNPVVVGRQL